MVNMRKRVANQWSQVLEASQIKNQTLKLMEL